MTGRAVRRRPRFRLWRTALSAVLLAAPVGASALAVLTSTPLAVSAVEVSGTGRLTPEQVRAATGVPLGGPLAAVEPDRVSDAVAALPEVASVSVQRQWPDRVTVAVAERAAVAAVRDGGPGVALLDPAGVSFARQDAPPPDVPLLELTGPGPDDAATTAALVVVSALPPQVRAQVGSVEASSPTAITLALDTGATVVWGGAERSQDKAVVLAALLPQDAEVYDVSAPEVAVTSG